MTTETQAAFARRIGVVRSRVHALKDRLVMVGKRVDVEASLARLAETAGDRIETVERVAEVEIPKAVDVDVVRRIDAQTRKEHLAGELMQIDLDERRGKLLRAEDVIAVVSGAATTLRSRLESFPDQLAPHLAVVNDEAQIRAMLADQVEIVLGELSQRFRELAA